MMLILQDAYIVLNHSMLEIIIILLTIVLAVYFLFRPTSKKEKDRFKANKLMVQDLLVLDNEKILGIIVLSLLLSGNAFTQELLVGEGSSRSAYNNTNLFKGTKVIKKKLKNTFAIKPKERQLIML